MGWKQPIDTDIYQWFGDDHLARDLFIHLLLNSQNKDMTQPKYFKGKPYQLKRGQVIFGRNEYAKKLRGTGSGTRKALVRLSEVYGKVTTKSTTDYTVITILNYDDLVKQGQAKSQASDKQVTSKEQASDTPKIVKSVESDKIDRGEGSKHHQQQFFSERSNGNTKLRSTEVDQYTKKFERFWELQIRKVGKGTAFKAWKKACKKKSWDGIVAAWEKQKPWYEKRERLQGTDAPHPATWLNGERWEDELDIEQIKTNGRHEKPKSDIL